MLYQILQYLITNLLLTYLLHELSLMLLLVAGDMVTARHTLTTPPHIASVHMQTPRLTTEYSKISNAKRESSTVKKQGDAKKDVRDVNIYYKLS